MILQTKDYDFRKVLKNTIKPWKVFFLRVFFGVFTYIIQFFSFIFKYAGVIH